MKKIKKNIPELHHTGLYKSLLYGKVKIKDLKPLGETIIKEGFSRWEIAYPDKKDEAGFIVKCSAVYYSFIEYTEDTVVLGL